MVEHTDYIVLIKIEKKKYLEIIFEILIILGWMDEWMDRKINK